jgi:hypothetical protein
LKLSRAIFQLFVIECFRGPHGNFIQGLNFVEGKLWKIWTLFSCPFLCCL